MCFAKKTEEIIHVLINTGYKYFGVGGALGFDTIAALKVLKLRKIYPEIKLIMVLPCLSQAKKWSENDVRIYEEIKKEADKIVCISHEYTKDCMYKRNRHLVDKSSICICYMTKSHVGTAYTVNYAISKNLTVINVSDLLHPEFYKL